MPRHNSTASINLHSAYVNGAGLANGAGLHGVNVSGLPNHFSTTGNKTYISVYNGRQQKRKSILTKNGLE